MPIFKIKNVAPGGFSPEKAQEIINKMKAKGVEIIDGYSSLARVNLGLPVDAEWKLVWDRRYEICKDCPLYNAEADRCTDCGCIMAAKTKSNTSECPRKKW